jgi:hypothetical protein
LGNVNLHPELIGADSTGGVAREAAPDVIVAPSLEDEAAGRDPQLDAALDILRRQTATQDV